MAFTRSLCIKGDGSIDREAPFPFSRLAFRLTSITCEGKVHAAANWDKQDLLIQESDSFQELLQISARDSDSVAQRRSNSLCRPWTHTTRTLSEADHEVALAGLRGRSTAEMIAFAMQQSARLRVLAIPPPCFTSFTASSTLTSWRTACWT